MNQRLSFLTVLQSNVCLQFFRRREWVDALHEAAACTDAAMGDIDNNAVSVLVSRTILAAD